MKFILFFIIAQSLYSCASSGFLGDQRIIQMESARIARMHAEQRSTTPTEEVKQFPVIEDIQKNSPYKTFSKEMCKGLKKDQCSNRYGEMIYARLKEGYPLADSGKVITHCQARPMECKKPQYIEERFIALQKEEEGRRSDEREESIRREVADMQEQERVKRAAAWQGFANALQQQQQQEEAKRQLNKPVNTYCQQNGRGVWCQSQ